MRADIEDGPAGPLRSQEVARLAREHLPDGIFHVTARAEDVRVFMQRLNGRYAQRFNLRHHRHGHVFGDRYTARAVVGDRQLQETQEYIAANPAKSGLIDEDRPWPWVWCEDGSGGATEGVGTG